MNTNESNGTVSWDKAGNEAVAASPEAQQPVIHHSKGPFITIILLLLFTAAILLVWNYAFTLQKIVVIGLNEGSDEDEAIAVSGLVIGRNMFLIQEEDISSNFSRQHMLVLKNTQKDYENRTIYLLVKKRVPVACVDNQGIYALLDIDGVILEKCTAEEASSYPALTGVQCSNMREGSVLSGMTTKCLNAYQAIMGCILPSDLIRTIKLSDPDSIEAESSDGYYLKLGDASDMSAKLKAYRIVRAYFLQDGTTGIITLTNPEEPLLLPDE